MQDLSTETITLPLTSGCSSFDVYRQAVSRYGERDAFLAESLQGPHVDCRESIVAVGRLASIAFDAHGIHVNGCQAVVRRLVAAMESALPGAQFDGSGRLRFADTESAWAALRPLVESTYRAAGEQGASHCGFVCRIGYDVARWIETLPQQMARDDEPLMRFDLFQNSIVCADGVVQLHLNYADDFPVPNVDALKSLLVPLPPLEECSLAAEQVSFTTSEAQYLNACEKALEHIRAGDIYQVQLGHDIRVRSTVSPLALYERLRRLNPSPYMFLWCSEDRDLIGASPESFVRLDGRTLTMRPIAGTLPKSSRVTPQTLERELLASEKENAEHLMLVDLCRNDIGRICEAGSLSVPSLMVLEEFPSLYHLVSTVGGKLRDACDVIDVLRATFPAGTMVGAPKVRAMEIIEALEQTPRGPYAGAVGFIAFGARQMNLALCIRMASHRDGEYRLRASAGIVYDSEPQREWRETLAKMGVMYQALSGEELST